MLSLVVDFGLFLFVLVPGGVGGVRGGAIPKKRSLRKVLTEHYKNTEM